MKKDKEWLKEELKKCLATSLNRDNHYSHGNRDAYSIALSFVDELDETEQTDTNVVISKPVIPQFVADYYKEYQNHELTFSEWFESPPLNKGSRAENETFKWLLDNDHETNLERQFILADIIAHGLDGYEVEKEKLYRVRAGNRYVRFNLDGSIIGAKKDNSIVFLERLSKLPFDYKKAVESGIITLEEVTL